MALSNVKIERRKRWDKPFAEDWQDEQLEQILKLPIFAAMEEDKFPNNLPLRGILRNDTRVVHYDPGDIVVREDDYGSSAYVIVSGEVSVVLPPGLPAHLLGRAESTGPEGWLKAFLRVFNRSDYRETRDYVQKDLEIIAGLHVEHGVARVRLQDHEKVLSDCTLFPIGEGELIGEVAALTRSPRTATMVVTKPSVLLEIRWQGFRDLRKFDDAFRERIDNIYRERNRVSYLKALPYFSSLDEPTVERLAEHALLESYGDLEWKADRKAGSNTVPDEPVIVAQNDYVDGLLIVLNGSARIVGKFHQGKQTVGFLRAGDFFGMSEIVAEHCDPQHEAHIVHDYSLTAIGHADVLRIPTDLVESELLSNLSDEEIERLQRDCAYPSMSMDPGLMEFFGQHHYTNGRSTMVIDTARCVRCDECVTACARNHDNNPRFIRHGRHFANLMVTTACMHCVDPVCMVGCPTGAISRRVDGEVVINDETCIGCSTCANSCPYDNIRMVEIKNKSGNLAVDQQTNKPIVKATKCDLCVDNLGGPACVRACPHDAMMRIDLTDAESLADLLARTTNFDS
ncbi:MAG: cyclic nucleotide-binding domain-containing protein [Gammaproteobacteria bacterium]|nr:cyclic nucleotide-binding domain-containing protein [Gammaproteobacteria bacterium]